MTRIIFLWVIRSAYGSGFIFAGSVIRGTVLHNFIFTGYIIGGTDENNFLVGYQKH